MCIRDRVKTNSQNKLTFVSINGSENTPEIGQLVFALPLQNPDVQYNYGDVITLSQIPLVVLRPSNAGGTSNTSHSFNSGSYRCLGRSEGTGTFEPDATLWQRVS